MIDYIRQHLKLSCLGCFSPLWTIFENGHLWRLLKNQPFFFWKDLIRDCLKFWITSICFDWRFLLTCTLHFTVVSSFETSYSLCPTVNFLLACITEARSPDRWIIKQTYVAFVWNLLIFRLYLEKLLIDDST